MKNNPRIRYACLEFDVRLWEVAEKLRMSDTKLSKMLRKKLSDIETDKMSANVQTSGTYQMAMAGLPTFNLLDNTNNTTQLVVNGKVLAEVVNEENRNREVAKA